MKKSQPNSERLNSSLGSPITAFLVAAQFLTILPPVIRRPVTARELGASVAFYPLVGMALGGVLFGVDHFLTFLVPPPLRSALILALWVILTGALHLDGLLDAFDGLFGGSTPESRLKIMRDERVGAYALAGGVLLLLIKFNCLSAINPRFAPLIVSPTLGRWAIVVSLVLFPYARTEGLGREIKDNATKQGFVFASLVTLVVSWLTAGWIGLIAIGVTALATWAGLILTRRRIPGMTGDTYGALNELIEVFVLITFVILQRV